MPRHPYKRDPKRNPNFGELSILESRLHSDEGRLGYKARPDFQGFGGSRPAPLRDLGLRAIHLKDHGT